MIRVLRTTLGLKSAVPLMAMTRLLAACHPGDDIVARPMPGEDASQPIPTEDAGRGELDASDAVPLKDADTISECCDAEAGTPEAGISPLRACAEGGDAFLLLTKEPRLFRVYADTGKVDDRGVPECLPPGSIVGAVDTEGLLWAVPSDGALRVISPDTLDCKQLPLQLKAEGMAFVYEPTLERARLYVSQAGKLSIVDPVSLAVSDTGVALAQGWLSGTADGALFAIEEPLGGAIAISQVDLGTTPATHGWKVAIPSTLPMSGAAVQRGGLSLLFGPELYRGSFEKDDLQLIGALSLQNPSVVAMGAPPCALLPK